MDWQVKIGLGVAVVFGLLPFAVKDMPPPITGAGISAGIMFIVWGLLPNHDRLPLGPALLFIMGMSSVLGAAFWYTLYDNREHPPLSYQKYALFFVQIDNDVYKFGIVAKLFNSSNIAYLVDNISFAGDFKALLPVRLQMKILGGKIAEIVLRGKWGISIPEDTIWTVPNFYYTHQERISMDEWEDIMRPKSKINIETFHYKYVPPRPQPTEPDINYLVYSQDKTATIDNPYFAQTQTVKTDDGIMLFIRGRGEPPIGSWTVLGHAYYEAWSDPQKLALYNSLFPPDKDGLPRPFGFFAGAESEMMGPVGRELFAPTTRAADILEFTWPQPEK